MPFVGLSTNGDNGRFVVLHDSMIDLGCQNPSHIGTRFMISLSLLLMICINFVHRKWGTGGDERASVNTFCIFSRSDADSSMDSGVIDWESLAILQVGFGLPLYKNTVIFNQIDFGVAYWETSEIATLAPRA
jgi:hypothetical protein